MRKIIAILGLLMLFLIQFGSVGFTVYKNECNKAKISTYTVKSVKCCCSKSNSKLESKVKSCCKTKSKASCSKPPKKTCCSSKSKTESVDKKCCSSDLMLFKLVCETFNVDSYSLNIEKTIDYQIAFIPRNKKSNTNFKSNTINGKYNCNSPPLIHVDKRIFIQSFQI